LTSRTIWVIAERDSDGVSKGTLEILGEGRKIARKLGGQLCVVLIGDQLGELINVFGHYSVDTIYILEHPSLADYNTEGFVINLTNLIRLYSPFLVMMGATPNGQDYIPRLAARIKTGIVTDCVQIRFNQQSDLDFIKPTHQGKIYTTITCPSASPYLVTIRPGSIGVEPPGEFQAPEVNSVTPIIRQDKPQINLLGLEKADPKSIEISEAEMIVAGGRGACTERDWKLIEEFAEALGASIGGTRMAVDMEFLPQNRMIGQTGKRVNPNLYLAVGISGAPHHLGGINSKSLVAITNDRGAPILQQCDLGIVSDIYEILPMLIQKLRLRRSRKNNFHGT
jgi:electron transfer flavoprotein alpha subunit